MDRAMCFLGGAALGALTTYFFDPQSGRRRRSVCEQGWSSFGHEAADALSVAGRDLAHRAQGWAAEARHLVTPDHADDHVICERVRAALGRAVSHPRAIDVTCRDSRVTLRGPVLAPEVDCLLGCVSRVRGVKGVDNQLDVHREAGNHPALQGGRHRRGATFDLMQNELSPASRFLLGAAGGTLFGWGMTKDAPTACVLGTIGLALAWPAATGRGLGQSFGIRGWRPIHVHKTINIAGPPDRVLPFFTQYANWPRFMRHLREVRDRGDGRSYWVASGPLGVPVSWGAVITQFEPNRLIAWRSEPGSTVHNAGTLRFEPTSNGNTRVSIHLSYVPPGGVLGHWAAKLFGADPKSEMDDDLIRLKGLIENGSASAPGKGEVARQDVLPTVRPEEPVPVM